VTKSSLSFIVRATVYRLSAAMKWVRRNERDKHRQRGVEVVNRSVLCQR